jgi:hypothetical protein
MPAVDAVDDVLVVDGVVSPLPAARMQNNVSANADVTCLFMRRFV